MSFKSLLCTALTALFLFSGTAMAKDTYINGIDAVYPPFAFIDEEGKASGFDVESMNWIADKMGFKIEHKPMDWAGIIPSLLAGKIDMVCSGMSISPERQELVTFSDPYWSIRKYLLVQEGSALTKDDLLTGKKKLGVQDGTNEAEFLQQKIDDGSYNYSIVRYENPNLAIEDLVNGRIDGAAIDSAPADDAMNKGKKPIKVIGDFAEPDSFGVATRNEDSELREKINEGYKLLKADPYWEELKDKYINVK